MKSQIEKNLFLIAQKISTSCKIYNKNINEINLVAVTKNVATENILAAISLGCKIFGENYIKESHEKWPEIKKQFPQIKLHFIGHLQSNKAHEAVSLFDCIESLDSKKLAQELQKEIIKQKKNPEIFIQVNIGQEQQKSGISPEEVRNFVQFAKNECNLNVVGLMAIPPLDEEPSPYFALLTKIARENNLQKISMGMSADFEEAIALGTTHIRLGTAIFGNRKI